MNDFSIELAAERIIDIRTKRYFAEVAGSYAAGHYRSAVVMLWSVVVCDILFKLDQLAKAHGDSIANRILTEIGEARTKNPNSPQWETDLVKKVASSTGFLDTAELSHLESLQAHRHLSAHPVLTATDALFSPNKETARAHIRNALEAVLTKPPIMSKKVFDAFIEDIEELSKLGPSRDDLRDYLEGKYLPHFSSATETAVFKSLWRVAFKSADGRADANRSINEQATSILFERHPSEILSSIEGDRAWFSDVSVAEGHLVHLTRFLRDHPKVFEVLTDAAKTPIRTYANMSLDNFALCWFLNADPAVHVATVQTRLKDDENLRMSSAAFQEVCRSLRTCEAAFATALHIGILLYGRSTSFDIADGRFAKFVRPFVDDFSREHVMAFLIANEQNKNGQTWVRGRGRSDHAEIKALIEKQFQDIPLDQFPHLIPPPLNE